MCDPVTLAVASAGAQTVSTIQQGRAVNSAARKTYRSALESEANQTTGLHRRHIETSRQIAQQGQDVVLEGRAAEASARNSAASGGVSGNTMLALVNEQRRQAAKNLGRVEDQRVNADLELQNSLSSLNTQTKNRIATTPTSKLTLVDLAIPFVGAGFQMASHDRQMDAIQSGQSLGG